MYRTLKVSVTFCVACLGSIPAIAVEQTIGAVSGFNSPNYQLGQPLWGQGQNDPGWGGSTWRTWWGNGSSSSTPHVTAYADPTAQEGDGDLHLTGSSPNNEVGAIRSWGVNLTAPFWIEQYVRLTNGTSFFTMRAGTNDYGPPTAVQWAVGNGHFTVRDGDGAGGGVFLDTGFAVNPMHWQKVATRIDPVTQTYQFFVDGQQYNAPHALHFRQNVTFVSEVNYLAQQEAWVDNIRVYSVPEPSTLVLIGIGVVGLLGWGWGRRKVLRSPDLGTTGLRTNPSAG